MFPVWCLFASEWIGFSSAEMGLMLNWTGSSASEFRDLHSRFCSVRLLEPLLVTTHLQNRQTFTQKGSGHSQMASGDWSGDRPGPLSRSTEPEDTLEAQLGKDAKTVLSFPKSPVTSTVCDDFKMETAVNPPGWGRRAGGYCCVTINSFCLLKSDRLRDVTTKMWILFQRETINCTSILMS